MAFKFGDRDYTRKYNEGIRDGFDGLPPAWLGIDPYKNGYERGVRSAAHPEGATLIAASPDGRERVYLVGESEIFVRFDERDGQWYGSVPGYGGYPCSTVRGAFSGIACTDVARAGRWFTADPGRVFPTRLVLVAAQVAA